jgi:hypothetical protein
MKVIEPEEGAKANRCPSSRYLYALLFLCITVTWLLPLPTSLWLDETVTYWAIKGSFPEMLHRTTGLQFFSIFFCLDWLMAKLGGANEIILRLPSLFAMLAALRVLYQIAREFFDAETALYAMILFAAHPLVANQAHYARPYALGLLLACLTMLYFARWLADQSLKHGMIFAVVSALAVYTHPFFGELLLSCTVLTCYRLLHGKIPNRVALLKIAGVLFILLLPAVPIYASLLARSHSLVYASTPSLLDFFFLLFPKYLVAALIPCLIAGLLLRVRLTPFLSSYRKQLVFLASWVLVPALTLFAISRLTSMKIFLEHYLITIVPGVVLILAALIRSCTSMPGGQRRSFADRLPVREILATIVVLVAVSIFLVKRNWTSLEDWRFAVRTAQSYQGGPGSSVPVFFDSSLIEAKQLEWLSDPVKKSYLLAPLAAYPMDGKVFALPFTLEDDASKGYASNLLSQVPGRRCIFIGRRSDDEFRMERAFRALALKAGFRTQYLYNHPKEGRPFVMLFER